MLIDSNVPAEVAADHELIRRIRSGSPPEVAAALHELMEYCRREIDPVLNRRVASADRDDLRQEICCFVLHNIHRYEIQDVPLSHWFATIARRKAQDHTRRARRERVHTAWEMEAETEDQALSANSAARADLRQRIQEQRRAAAPANPDSNAQLDHLTQIECDRLIKHILDRLPPAERHVLALMWFRQLTDYEEIGRLLDMKEGTVRVYVHRIRRRLSRLPELRQLYDDLGFS